MSAIQSPVEVEERLASFIKASVERAIEERGVEVAAAALGMHPVGLEILLRSNRWTLPIALRVAVRLGLPDGQLLEDALRHRV